MWHFWESVTILRVWCRLLTLQMLEMEFCCHQQASSALNQHQPCRIIAFLLQSCLNGVSSVNNLGGRSNISNVCSVSSVNDVISVNSVNSLKRAAISISDDILLHNSRKVNSILSLVIFVAWFSIWIVHQFQEDIFSPSSCDQPVPLRILISA